MNKFARAAMASAIVFTAVVPNTAFAVVPVPPPIPMAGGAGAGAAVTGGFIGFVGLLVTYDLIRRTSCSGDFLGFGGPGFSEPITPAMSVITPPICAPIHKINMHKKPVLRAKG